MTLLRFTPLPPSDGIGRYLPHDGRPRYFVRLGQQWPHDPSKRLIDETTPDIAQARQFGSDEEAREVLVVSGHPKGWELVSE